MNYHLHRNGKNLGVFTIEELRQREASGELNGSELVWTAGMASWQPLDSVLSPSTSSARPPKRPVGMLPFVLLGILGVLSISAMAVLGWKTVPSTIEKLSLNWPDQSLSSTHTSAMAAAGKPVLDTSNSLTEVEVTKTRREFRLRQYLDGYKLRGQRDAECDALALGLISNWIACNYNGAVNTNLPALTDLSNQLANDRHCTDPLVLTVAAANSIELHESIRRWERAVKGFQDSKHLGYPKFYATAMLAEKLIYDQADRRPALDAQSLQNLQAALTDGSIRPEDQPDIANTLVFDWAHNFFLRNAPELCAMVEKQGHPFQWLALTLRGENEINQAWKVRGGGYVNTVSEAGWQGFESHMAAARNYFTQAWELNTNWALAPDRMIYVSLGDADIGEMRKWFDRTVAVQIDYADAWAKMRWGLRPRWYGDTDAMLAFGITALNTHRFDTDVPRIFFDSVSDVESELYLAAGQHIYDRQDVWPHLQELYEGYLASPTQTDWTRDGWRSSYVAVAYLAEKYDVARIQLQQLNWHPHPGSFEGWQRDLSLLPQEVAARTGSQADLVAEAENDRDSNRLGEALKIYHGLTLATNVDDLTRSFARERQYALGLENHLAAGEWVPFLPNDTNFTGWQINFGDFQLLPDGAWEVSSTEAGHMAYCRARIGTEFEIKGQFEVVKSTTNAFQAGLVMGMPHFNTYNWNAFRIKRNADEGDVASYSQGWFKRQVLAHLDNLDSRTNSFDIRFQEGQVNALVNGRPVFMQTKAPQNYYLVTNEFLVGLGAFNNSDATVIRYRDVQLRRLPAK